MDKSLVEQSNELPKCQAESAASAVAADRSVSNENPPISYAVSIGFGLSRRTGVTGALSGTAGVE